jgi:hypothetical protein
MAKTTQLLDLDMSYCLYASNNPRSGASRRSLTVSASEESRFFRKKTVGGRRQRGISGNTRWAWTAMGGPTVRKNFSLTRKFAHLNRILNRCQAGYLGEDRVSTEIIGYVQPVGFSFSQCFQITCILFVANSLQRASFLRTQCALPWPLVGFPA